MSEHRLTFAYPWDRALYIRLDASNCILTHCDRTRLSRVCEWQALQRLFLFDFFIGLFFSFFIHFLLLAVQHCRCSRGGSTVRCWGQQRRPAFWRVAARGNRSLSWPSESAPTLFYEATDPISFGRIWCFNGSTQHSRWSGRNTLIFRIDISKQSRSGCIHSIRHRGFRVLSTLPQWQSVVVDNVSDLFARSSSLAPSFEAGPFRLTVSRQSS